MADYSLLVNIEAIDKASAIFDKLRGNIEQFKSETENMGLSGASSAEQLASSFKTAGESMASTGKLMTASLSVPIVGLGVASTKAAVGFEEAFTGVRKTVDTTEENFKKLSDGIKQMSTETASSKNQIAGVMEVAGQLGVEVGKDGKNLLDFTRIMIQLGDTTNLSAEEAATALAHFMNITGVAQSQASNLGSAIVDLGNNFATDEASILSMSTRLASAGTIAGLSSTDILALSTAMSSVGIQAEAGGTAMAQTLAAITSEVANFTAGTTNSLDRIASISGLSADEFAKKWNEKPIEALQAFIAGLGTLDQRGENATLVLDELGMSGVRQANMLQSLGLASGVLGNAINISSDAFAENTALAAEAEKRYSTTASQISQLKEQFSNCAVVVGDMLIPFMQKGMDILSGVAEGFNNLSPATQRMIVNAAAVAAAAGPLLLVGGKLVSGIGTLISVGSKVGGLVSGIGSSAASAAAPVTSAGTAVGTLTSNALGFIALGAGILLAAAGLALLAQSAIALSEAGAPAAIAMGSMVAVIAGLAAGAAALAPALTAGAAGLVAFGAAVAAVGVGILAMGEGVNLACQGISTLMDAVGRLTEKLPTVSEHGEKAATALLAISAGAVALGTSAAACGVSLAALAVASGSADLALAAFDIEMGVAVPIVGALDLALVAMLGSISGIADAASSASKSMSDIEGSVNVVKTGVSGLGDMFTNAVDTIIKVFTKNTSKATDAAEKFGSGITTGTKQGMSPITENVTATMTAVTLTFSKSGETILTSWTSALAKMTSTAQQKMMQMSNNMQQTLTRIQTMFANTKLAFNQTIALPHFSMSGKFDPQSGQVPNVNVTWYSKAYEQAYMFSSPTTVGAAGFGDGSGNEIVSGDEHLIDLMREAFGDNDGGGDIIIPVYIGSDRIDELVVTAQKRNDYRSGGR